MRRFVTLETSVIVPPSGIGIAKLPLEDADWFETHKMVIEESGGHPSMRTLVWMVFVGNVYRFPVVPDSLVSGIHSSVFGDAIGSNLRLTKLLRGLAIRVFFQNLSDEPVMVSVKVKGEAAPKTEEATA